MTAIEKSFKNMKQYLILIFFFFFVSLSISAQEWQWSVPVEGIISNETNDHPRAFLWIPPNCRQVRGIVVGQHNMIEEGILEHPDFRKAMTELGFAEIWVSPNFSITFDFNKSDTDHFNSMMKALATVSGYHELEFAPVVQIGHSALASYPWNFAAWNTKRTLATISIHGDAPLTKLTGSGRPNPDWGNKTIEGVPALFVMGEYEWWEDRITPAFEYVAQHPKAPVSLFADAGHGHFDYSDELVNYLAMFIKKAAEYRLPLQMPLTKFASLKFIDPAKGWLIDRWRKDSLSMAHAASYKKYKGERKFSSWVFDKEMADATEKFYAAARGRRQQYLGFMQNGKVEKPDKSHANYTLKFKPMMDGISFTVTSFFADSSGMIPTSSHASTALHIERICGPVKKINDSTFQISFYRMGFNNPKRSNDIWLLASNKGDKVYKSIVQQANMKFPLKNSEGVQQKINFQGIGNQKFGVSSVYLTAFTDSNLPVSFYVKEGPAVVQGSQLKITKIPPRTKFPIKVTVVAWQYGRTTEPKIQSAEPVEKSFYIIN